jgi:isopenicillin N synthase-like dioxygenase
MSSHARVARRRPLPRPSQRLHASFSAKSPNTSNAEDAIIRRIFDLIPSKNLLRYCVDVGAKDGLENSKTYSLLLPRQGQPEKWFGVLLESDLNLFAQLKKLHKPRGNRCLNLAVSTSEGSANGNLLAILRHYLPELPTEFDLLCTNGEGSSYWILLDFWRTGRYYPKLICASFNPTMPNDLAYVPQRDDPYQTSASLAAFLELAQQNGYELIATTHETAFFAQGPLYDDYLQSAFPDTSIDEVHKTPTPSPNSYAGRDERIADNRQQHEEILRVPYLRHKPSFESSCGASSLNGRKRKKLPEPPGCSSMEIASQHSRKRQDLYTQQHKSVAQEKEPPLPPITSPARRIDFSAFPWLKGKGTKSTEPFEREEPASPRRFQHSVTQSTQHASSNKIERRRKPLDPPDARDDAPPTPSEEEIHDGSEQKRTRSQINFSPRQRKRAFHAPMMGLVDTPSADPPPSSLASELAGHKSVTDPYQTGPRFPTTTRAPKVEKDVDTGFPWINESNRTTSNSFDDMPRYSHNHVVPVSMDEGMDLSNFSNADDISAMLDSVMAESVLAGTASIADASEIWEIREGRVSEPAPRRTFSPEGLLKKIAVDMSPYCVGRRSSESDKHTCANLLIRQLRMKGFALVRGTGISRFQCADALNASNSFLHEADESVRRSCLAENSLERGYSPMCTEHSGIEDLNDMVRRFRMGGADSSKALRSDSAGRDVWPDEAVWEEDASDYFRGSLEDYRDVAFRAALSIVDCICDSVYENVPELKEAMEILSEKEFLHASDITLMGCRRGSRHIAQKPLVMPCKDDSIITILMLDGDCALFQHEEEEGIWRDATFPQVVPDDPIFIVYVGDRLSELSKGRFVSNPRRVIPAAGTLPANALMLSIRLDTGNKVNPSGPLPPSSSAQLQFERGTSPRRQSSPGCSPVQFESEPQSIQTGPKEIDNICSRGGTSDSDEKGDIPFSWYDPALFKGLSNEQRSQLVDQIVKLEEWRTNKVENSHWGIPDFRTKLTRITEGNSKLLKTTSSLQQPVPKSEFYNHGTGKISAKSNAVQPTSGYDTSKIWKKLLPEKPRSPVMNSQAVTSSEPQSDKPSPRLSLNLPNFGSSDFSFRSLTRDTSQVVHSDGSTDRSKALIDSIPIMNSQQPSSQSKPYFHRHLRSANEEGIGNLDFSFRRLGINIQLSNSIEEGDGLLETSSQEEETTGLVEEETTRLVDALFDQPSFEFERLSQVSLRGANKQDHRSEASSPQQFSGHPSQIQSRVGIYHDRLKKRIHNKATAPVISSSHQSSQESQPHSHDPDSNGNLAENSETRFAVRRFRKGKAQLPSAMKAIDDRLKRLSKNRRSPKEDMPAHGTGSLTIGSNKRNVRRHIEPPSSHVDHVPERNSTPPPGSPKRQIQVNREQSSSHVAFVSERNSTPPPGSPRRPIQVNPEGSTPSFGSPKRPIQLDKKESYPRLGSPKRPIQVENHFDDLSADSSSDPTSFHLRKSSKASRDLLSRPDLDQSVPANLSAFSDSFHQILNVASSAAVSEAPPEAEDGITAFYNRMKDSPAPSWNFEPEKSRSKSTLASSKSVDPPADDTRKPTYRERQEKETGITAETSFRPQGAGVAFDTMTEVRLLTVDEESDYASRITPKAKGGRGKPSWWSSWGSSHDNDLRSTSSDSRFPYHKDKYDAIPPDRLYRKNLIGTGTHFQNRDDNNRYAGAEFYKYGALIDNSTSLSLETAPSTITSTDRKQIIGLDPDGGSVVRHAGTEPTFSAHRSDEGNTPEYPVNLESNEQRKDSGSEDNVLNPENGSRREDLDASNIGYDKYETSSRSGAIETSKLHKPFKSEPNLPVNWTKKINLSANLIQEAQKVDESTKTCSREKEHYPARTSGDLTSSDKMERREIDEAPTTSQESGSDASTSRDSEMNLSDSEEEEVDLPVSAHGSQLRRLREAISNNSSAFAIASESGSGEVFVGVVKGEDVQGCLHGAETIFGGKVHGNRTAGRRGDPQGHHRIRAVSCLLGDEADQTNLYRATFPNDETNTTKKRGKDCEAESRESNYHLNTEGYGLEEAQTRLAKQSPSGLEIYNSWSHLSNAGKGNEARSLSSISEMTDDQKVAASCTRVCMSENLHNLRQDYM